MEEAATDESVDDRAVVAVGPHQPVEKQLVRERDRPRPVEVLRPDEPLIVTDERLRVVALEVVDNSGSAQKAAPPERELARERLRVRRGVPFGVDEVLDPLRREVVVANVHTIPCRSPGVNVAFVSNNG